MVPKDPVETEVSVHRMCSLFPEAGSVGGLSENARQQKAKGANVGGKTVMQKIPDYAETRSSWRAELSGVTQCVPARWECKLSFRVQVRCLPDRPCLTPGDPFDALLPSGTVS